MATREIQPFNQNGSETAPKDRDALAVAPEESLELLESWAELHEHPEFWPDVCRKWADRIDDDEAMIRLKPILNNLFRYTAKRDGDTIGILREKMRRTIDKGGKNTLLINRRGVIQSINEDATEILGFAAGESVKEQLLEPLNHLFQEAEQSAKGSLSEIFGRDGVRRLINVHRFDGKSEDEVALKISICNVFLPAAAENYFRGKLSLTDTEIEILSLSIQRHNIDSIARKRNNSVSTIRTHIKNITSKLGCKNFNDVMVRTLEIIAYHEKDRPSALDEIGDIFPTRQGVQILKLERHKGQIEYSTYGDPNMRPLLTLHSLEYGYKPSDEFISLARKSGFCVYSVRRPGFGLSTRGSSNREDAERLEEFLTLLNLKNILAVSFSTASPIALALTQSCERIAQTICVNYAFNAKSKLQDVEPKWLKGLLDLCLASQASFNFAHMLTGNLIKISGHSGFYEKLYESCTEDLAYLREHPDEFEKATKALLSADRDTVRRDIVSNFLDNPEVNDILTGCKNIVSLFGEHTHGVPLKSAKSEAVDRRLLFFAIENTGRNCVFQRPDAFFSIFNGLNQVDIAQAN